MRRWGSRCYDEGYYWMPVSFDGRYRKYAPNQPGSEMVGMTGTVGDIGRDNHARRSRGAVGIGLKYRSYGRNYNRQRRITRSAQKTTTLPSFPAATRYLASPL
jgi:hypothetical protein